VVEGCEGTKKCRRQRGRAQKAGEWEYGSVRSIPTPIYLPLQVAAHRARHFVPAPRARHTQALTGRQVPPISRHWTTKWWCSGAEMECPTHLVCSASQRFGNHGHDRLGPRDFRCVASRRFGDRGYDCLGPRDFRCTVTAHGELWHMMVLPGTPNIAMSHANRGSSRINRVVPQRQNSNVQDSKKAARERMLAPPVGSQPLSGWARGPLLVP
jgi:hypothetical protein